MKKIIYPILLASVASLMIARAQTNSTAPSQPVDNTNAATAAAATNSPPDTTAAPPAPGTNAAPAVADTNAVATSTTNATATGVETIPLIQFSDVPITTAIEHLARQAGINYMLDPKIAYGQPDQSGQIKQEPVLSIRWENITAESALRALLDNYSLQLIVDKKTGIDRVALKDPLAPPVLITRVVQLQYASVTNMTEAVQSVLGDKRSRVLPDSRTSQLLVVATEPEQAAVDTLIEQLDKPTKQVLIETKLIEISSNPTAKRGVDWSSTLNAQHVTFGNGNIIPDPSVTHTVSTTPGPTGSTTVTGGTPPVTTTKNFPSNVSHNTILTMLDRKSVV